MVKLWWILGALNGFLAVGAGAFAAHALCPRLETRLLEVFETGARYQMYHALALLGVAWLAARSGSAVGNAAGGCFLMGTLLFSGSLYAMALTGWTRLGLVTPIGGVAFLAGWVLLAAGATRLS